MFDHLDEMVNNAREVRITNFLIQAEQAAIQMAQEIVRHPSDCIIWLFGDACDCGRFLQCETPEGE